jgi:tetratricopeptide (TPR) repeat protein
VGPVFRSVFAAALNRPAEVAATVEATYRTVPHAAASGRYGGEALLIDAYLALDEHDKLLVLARRIRQEAPGRTVAFVHEAQALAALGRLHELDALIEECRSTVGGACNTAWVLVQASWHLTAYGHREQALDHAGRAVALYEAMSDEELMERGNAVAYLWALRAAERWDTYGEFAARCVDEKPADPELPWFRSCVGMAAAHRGDRAAATAILGQLEAEGQYNPAAYVAAHLGERDRAIELLRRSLADGVFTYTQIKHWDLDLQPLWDYPPFQELIRPKG